MVVEVGTHSARVQEVICGYGHEVVVANPRLMEGSKESLPLGYSVRLVIFLAASGIGGMMIAHGSHSVGVKDGGPRLPNRELEAQKAETCERTFSGSARPAGIANNCFPNQ
jgi:hypothetical protein